MQPEALDVGARARSTRSRLSRLGRLGRLAWIAAVVCTASLSTGCFAWIRSLREGQVCRPEAARSTGERDALAGREPRESYAAICGVSEAALNQRYREAYEGVPADQRGTGRGLLGRLLP